MLEGSKTPGGAGTRTGHMGQKRNLEMKRFTVREGTNTRTHATPLPAGGEQATEGVAFSPTRIAERTREVARKLSTSRKRPHGTHAAAWQRFDERHHSRPDRKLAATPNARLCHTEPGARARRDARPQLDHDLCCVHDGSRSRSVFNRTCSDVAMTSHTRSRSRCYQLPRSSRGTRGYFAA